MVGIIWAVIVVLFALWVIGLLFKIAGPLIHILLVIAVILVAYNFFTSGRLGL